MQCIFRKPKECKERHKILMDRSAGDGADSAEDSGSSQSYPSTLPGIPKARSYLSFLTMMSTLSRHWNASCVPLSLFWSYCFGIHAGQCQTVVSTPAGANGRGYHQGSL